MSNICILTASGVKIDRNDLKMLVQQEVNQIDCGVFFGIECIECFEQFSEQYDNSSFICSFSDDYRFDNCEMLLLPDNWWLDDKTNIVPFYTRMELLKQVIEKICKVADKVELYVGDAGGNTIEEFDKVYIEIQSFPNIMNRLFTNTDSFPAFHFIFI